MGIWRLVFCIMIIMGIYHMYASDPGGPLTLAFRITLILVGSIGLMVLYIREPRQRDDNAAQVETQKRIQPITHERPKPSIGRLLLVLGILVTVMLGIILFAYFVTSG